MSAEQDFDQFDLIFWPGGLSAWSSCPQPSGVWLSRLSALTSRGSESDSTSSGGLTLNPFRSGEAPRRVHLRPLKYQKPALKSRIQSVFFFFFFLKLFSMGFWCLDSSCHRYGLWGMFLSVQGLFQSHPVRLGYKKRVGCRRKTKQPCARVTSNVTSLPSCKDVKRHRAQQGISEIEWNRNTLQM